MDHAEDVDLLTDEEEDEHTELKMAVPKLDSLILEFENGDEVIDRDKEEKKKFVAEMKAAAQPIEARRNIIVPNITKYNLLDQNISSQRSL